MAAAAQQTEQHFANNNQEDKKQASTSSSSVYSIAMNSQTNERHLVCSAAEAAIANQQIKSTSNSVNELLDDHQRHQQCKNNSLVS
jgi:hypothetical protein